MAPLSSKNLGYPPQKFKHLDRPYHGLLDCMQFPLTRAQTELMIRCTLADSHPKDSNTEKLLDALRKSQIGEIFLDKLERVPGILDKCTGSAILMFSHLSGRAGSIVMWAYTAAYIVALEGKLDMDGFVKYFPMGIPEEAAYEKAWDSQKMKYIGIPHEKHEAWFNWLDSDEAWKF